MRRIRRWFTYTIGATVGAALAYLFDPDQGTVRRAQLTEQVRTAVRGGRTDTEAPAPYGAGEAASATEQALRAS